MHSNLSNFDPGIYIYIYCRNEIGHLCPCLAGLLRSNYIVLMFNDTVWMQFLLYSLLYLNCFAVLIKEIIYIFLKNMSLSHLTFAFWCRYFGHFKRLLKVIWLFSISFSVWSFIRGRHTSLCKGLYSNPLLRLK